MLRIEIEMDAGRENTRGRVRVERYVWSVSGARVEQCKVDVHGLARDVIEGTRPEFDLRVEVIDAYDD